MSVKPSQVRFSQLVQDADQPPDSIAEHLNIWLASSHVIQLSIAEKSSERNFVQPFRQKKATARVRPFSAPVQCQKVQVCDTLNDKKDMCAHPPPVPRLILVPQKGNGVDIRAQTSRRESHHIPAFRSHSYRGPDHGTRNRRIEDLIQNNGTNPWHSSPASHPPRRADEERPPPLHEDSTSVHGTGAIGVNAAPGAIYAPSRRLHCPFVVGRGIGRGRTGTGTGTGTGRGSEGERGREGERL